jgi:hypothetical protein
MAATPPGAVHFVVTLMSSRRHSWRPGASGSDGRDESRRYGTGITEI